VISLDGLEQSLVSAGSDPQDVAARHDLQRAVRYAIASLPPHYRDTIALQAFGELSYDEIAKALDIPLGTVMSRLNGAKRLLRVLRIPGIAGYRRLGTAFAVASIGVLAAAGSAFAAPSALPDNLLYPVKQLEESLRLELAPLNERLTIQLQLANERLREAQAM